MQAATFHALLRGLTTPYGNYYATAPVTLQAGTNPTLSVSASSLATTSLTGALFVLLASTSIGASASPDVHASTAHRGRPPVEVWGPVEGGAGQVTPTVQDLAPLGYVEAEFFFGGTATSYTSERKPSGVRNARPARRHRHPSSASSAPRR